MVPTSRYVLFQIGYPAPSNNSWEPFSRQFVGSTEEFLETIKQVSSITGESNKEIATLRANLRGIHDFAGNAVNGIDTTISNSDNPFNSTQADSLWNLYGLFPSQSVSLFELEGLRIELIKILKHATWRLAQLDNFQANALKNIQQKSNGIDYELVSILSEAKQYQVQQSNKKRERDIINAAYQWRRSLSVLEDTFRSKEEEMRRGRLS